jgi:hypothetical protein
MRSDRPANGTPSRLTGVVVAALLSASAGGGLLSALDVHRSTDLDARERRHSQTAGNRATLKQLGKGLYLTSGGSTEMPFIDHAVIGIRWSALEPRDQVFPPAAWRRMGQLKRRETDLKVRLRIMAGRFAPSFVKRLGGPPISSEQKDCSTEGGIAIVQPANGIASCVPYFWTDVVLRQYKELMTEVARRFDRDPRVLDVVNSACMTNWAEPFIRSGNDLASNARLWNAGLNEATDRYCMERSMRIHDRAFDRTRISLATHQQWQIVVDPAIDSDGVAPSWEKERELLEDLLARYGAKLILQNNGLGGDEGCPPSTPPNSTLYCWMGSELKRKGFQLEGDRKLESEGFSMLDAVQRGLDLGACFIEHNQFGSDADLAERYDHRLKQNCN